MRGFVHVPRAGESAPDRAAIGGKASALAALAAVRGPGGAAPEVPRWVALRTEAFETLAAPALASAGDAASGLEALRAIGPPAALRQALREALVEAGLWGRDVAVRSSAAAEDGASASFAGQYESVLGVPLGEGDEALWDAIRRVWGSVTSAHALAYGGTRGARGPSMAVLIQEMVEPVAAGVAFDADPVSGDRDVVVVGAVEGLGEGLVSGDLPADTFRLAEQGGGWRVLAREIVPKTHALRASNGRIERVAVPSERVNAPAITDAQAAEIAGWTRAVSRALGAPQDIEWALVGGGTPRVVLLQSRPITTLGDGSPGAPAGLAAERRIWDNSNIVESYSGVTTPLTFTFARAVYEDVYRQFCAVMGVPKRLLDSQSGVFANMLGLVRGRVYYQLLNWYRTLGLLPGFAFNRGFMERMMGVRERLEDPPPPAGSGDRLRDLARLVAMVARMLRESWRLKRAVPAFHAHVESVIGPLAREDLAGRTPAELAALYRRLERELLANWRAPLVNDFFAMVYFGILCRLIERWLPGAPPTLANDLLCGEGGIISTEPARAVMALARAAAADAGLRAAFAGGDGDAALWRRLHGPASPPAFAARLDAYVSRFGDRCMNELKLETVTLREDPGFLLAMVRTYVAQGTADPDAALARERAIRAAAESRVRAGLGVVQGLVFRHVLGQARARVRDRENLRFERTRVFGLVRRLVLALGVHAAAAGRLAEPRDVFLLTLEELLADAAGMPAPGGFHTRAAARRARFDAWARGVAPPDRFETRGRVTDWLAYDPPELATIAAVVPPGGDALQGLGCCPGVVRARVRVVHDPAQARDLAGHILVAERTDPGWTLLFPAVSGLLVQRGSLLSHSAIVAREMGIPCVVGIPHLLETLRDGDEVELDGTTGVVRRVGGPEGA
jgi:pyruvate,water dikinase